MDIIELAQAITGDTNNSVLFNYWKDKAVVIIIKYLNKDYTKEEVEALFKDAIIQILCDEFKKYDKFKKHGDVVQVSQGSRSVQFNTESVVTGRITLTSEVKALLPKPYMRLK